MRQGGFPLSRNFYVRTDVKFNWLEQGSTFTFTRGFSSPLLKFTHVKPVKVYVRTHVKIMRQWKSTFKLAFKGTEENSKIVHQLETPVCLLRVN